MSGSGSGGSGTSFRAVISAARSRTAAAAAAPLASAARSTRLTVSRTPARSSSRPGGLLERDGGRGPVGHRGQARRHGRARHAEPGVAGGEAVPAGRAVIPGPRHGDRAEHGVDDLVPVGDEPGLMAVAAGNPRAAVAGIGGQQLPQHAAAELQQPGAEHCLRCLHAGIAAAQGLGRFS